MTTKDKRPFWMWSTKEKVDHTEKAYREAYKRWRDAESARHMAEHREQEALRLVKSVWEDLRRYDKQLKAEQEAERGVG